MAISFKDKIAYVNKFADKGDDKLQKVIKLSVNIDSPKLNLTDVQKDKIKASLQVAFDRIRKIQQGTTQATKKPMLNLNALAKQIKEKEGITFDEARIKAKKAFEAKKNGQLDAVKKVLQDFKNKVGKIDYKRATTKTDIKRDMERPALRAGKRKVTTDGYTTNAYGTFKNKIGKVYYESRANRMDVNQPSKKRYPKLAEGGVIGSGKNGYIAFYKGKRIEVYADTQYGAQQTAAKHFKAKKEWEVNVSLAEVDGKPYMRSTAFAKGGQTGKLEKGVYRIGKPKRISANLYEQKIFEIFDDGSIATASDYGRKISDFKSQKYPIVTQEQFEAQYKFANGGGVEARYTEGKAYGRSNPIGKRAVVPIQMDENFSFYDYMKTMKKPTGFDVMGIKDGKNVKLNDSPISKREADKMYDEAKRNGYTEVQIEGVVFADGGMMKYAEGGSTKEEISNIFSDLKKGDKIDIFYGDSISRNNKNTLKVKSKNVVGKGKSFESEKITFENVENPSGVNFYAYKRKDGNIGFAVGDMAISVINIEHHSAFAQGGMVEHGLKNGDKIISGKVIGTTVRVRNEGLDEDARVDLNTGKRTILVYDKKAKKFTEM